MTKTMVPPEIAIVGGGPSGLTLAALLEAKGIDYVVFERCQKEAPPHGGCLDLHPGSGQRALKEARLFDEFKRNSRDGEATIHRLFDHEGNQVFQFGEGRDAPEIDRWALRKVLLTGIPEEKIQWTKAVEKANRDPTTGHIVLFFADGTTASGFKLVVGADGTFSKIRPLVTTARPVYSTKLYITTKIFPSNPFYPVMETLAGKGSMIVMGKGRHMFNSRQGDGHYRVDVGIEGPENFAQAGIVDLADHEAAKDFMLSQDSFGTYAPKMQDIIRHSEGPFWPWIMYYMPTDQLNWSPCPDVTLIGDAAHVTTPFVGDGVNCAMRDAIILSTKLKELGITPEAIAAYEKEMFPFAIDLITRSLKSMEMFFEADSPKRFLEVMTSDKRLIGTTDYI